MKVPRYVCNFMEKAPSCVCAWEDSLLRKDPAAGKESRFEEYDKESAAVLSTDVNMLRSVSSSFSSSASSSDAGIFFCAAADQEGLHLYLRYREERVEEVLAGLAPGAMFEMYFRPGEGECYFQWMENLYPEKTTFVSWTSPHRSYRKMDSFYRREIAPVADGMGIAMFLPWLLIYDKLPTNDSEWPLGIIVWGPRGGYSWGGGKVHELNRFGRLVFRDAGAWLPRIRRSIVLKAFGAFRQACPDVRNFWVDEVKGDLPFYEEVLKSQIERLLEAGEAVSPGMSREDSDRLFLEAVPDWMEFPYLLSELRKSWLKERLFPG